MSAPDFTLRANFSHEDKEAKGLRSLREPQVAPMPPVYYTAIEVAEMYPRLLLLGERGAGKSVLARKLATQHAATLIDLAATGLPASLPEGNLVLDGIDRLGPDCEAVLLDLLVDLGERGVILLGDGAVVRAWRLPTGYSVHSLLPLTQAERAQYLAVTGQQHQAPLSPAAANPALFALALSVEQAVDTPEDLIDAAFDDNPARAARAFASVADNSSHNRAVDDVLAARHLQTYDDVAIAALFLGDPLKWSFSLQSLLRRDASIARRLAPHLLAQDSDAALKGALLICGQDISTPVQQKLLLIVEQGRLSLPERDEAARHLARLGDPRDLERLCAVPGGSFTMGSDTHPNSQPVHTATVAPFRIGAYPVTNGAYARFAEATNRSWHSPEASIPERRNAPATDLTWHDARAYCAWLTEQWRRSGRIGTSEIVRLPTEPEWERAARGDQPDAGAEITYPWGLGWNTAALNSEESGVNAPCAVGLFPLGASPYGCLDMAGQIWEWTTTLWGSDMATPSFAYPYRDDGRENIGAPADIRRVLRGGCFSSTSLKACCTYRGSLEPNGFWRGNGFRIVVSDALD